PAESFARIDMDDHKTAVEVIEGIIGSDRAERSRDALIEAKRRVLFDHNIFALLDRTLATLDAGGRGSTAAAVTLVPEPAIVARYSRPPLAARLKESVRLALKRYPRLFATLRACYRLAASMLGARREVRS
ncbi:MAG TPA: hypothetical protein VLX44_13895, partial [Xanthobacteraceae bacterium]|nr:hypothetical protein [Xanthobacteraceae bacterium]